MTDWSIWMLEYARRPEQPVGLVLYGYWNAGTVAVPFSYVYMESPEHRVLVDVGYDAESYGGQLAQNDGVVGWQDARQVLAAVGRSPEDIDVVLITHAHFDHIGNLAAFPNAHVFLQGREVEAWDEILGRGRAFSRLAGALDPADLLHLASLRQQGRLTLLAGPTEQLLPGVSVRTAFDTHTAGSQYVVVQSRQGDWVMAGDNIYSYGNVEGDGDGSLIPIGFSAGSQTNNLLSMQDMLTAAGGSRRLVIVHEGETFQRHPSAVGSGGLRIAELCLAPGMPSRLPGPVAGSGTGGADGGRATPAPDTTA